MTSHSFGTILAFAKNDVCTPDSLTGQDLFGSNLLVMMEEILVNDNTAPTVADDAKL